MARYQLPHFSHHQREMYLTRRRFSLSVLALFAIASVTLGLKFRASEAATMVTISGRVYNSSNGAGLSGVTLKLCSGNPNVVTNSSGNWSYTLSQWHWFCTEYASGAPSTVAFNDAPNRTAEAKTAGQTYYESQVAGVNCYHNASCASDAQKYDRSVDNGYDLRFVTKVVATPVPTPKPPTPTPKPPVPTPKPTTPTPKPATPKPTVKPTKAPTVTVPQIAAVQSAESSDTVAPTTPGDFSLVVSGDNALVDLSWSASTDPSGIKGYMIERSLDQSTWSAILTAPIVETKYQDAHAAFGLHYFYRVKAIDNAGNASAYALADTTTPEFSNNTSTDNATTYTSEDGLAAVLLPNGAITGDAGCTITKGTDDKLGTKQRPQVSGPYQLLCKTAGGDVITTLNHPVTWTYQLKNKLKGVTGPVGYVLDDSRKAVAAGDSKYDSKSQVLQFSAASAGTTVVLAAVKAGLPINLIIIIVAALLLIVAFVTFILRRAQKQKYDDYLRQKYYNL